MMRSPRAWRAAERHRCHDSNSTVNADARDLASCYGLRSHDAPRRKVDHVDAYNSVEGPAVVDVDDGLVEDPQLAHYGTQACIADLALALSLPMK